MLGPPATADMTGNSDVVGRGPETPSPPSYRASGDQRSSLLGVLIAAHADLATAPCSKSWSRANGSTLMIIWRWSVRLGVGKSWLASATRTQSLPATIAPCSITASQSYSRISRWRAATVAIRVSCAISAVLDLLILDDWGLEPLDAAARHDLLASKTIWPPLRRPSPHELPVDRWHEIIGRSHIRRRDPGPSSFTMLTNSPAKACDGPEVDKTRRLDQTSSPVTQNLRPERLATRAASFRYGGRQHPGIPGGINPRPFNSEVQRADFWR